MTDEQQNGQADHKQEAIEICEPLRDYFYNAHSTSQCDVYVARRIGIGLWWGVVPLRSLSSRLPLTMMTLSHTHTTVDDEGAHVGCQSGLRPRDTPLGLILFLVPTLLPIP